jgi:hypothetical protein
MIDAKDEHKKDRVDNRRLKAQQKQNIEEQYEQIRQQKRVEMGLPLEEDREGNSDSDDGDNQNENPEALAVEEDDGGMFEKE